MKISGAKPIIVVSGCFLRVFTQNHNRPLTRLVWALPLDCFSSFVSACALGGCRWQVWCSAVESLGSVEGILTGKHCSSLISSFFLPAIGFPCDVLACTKSGNDDLTWWHHGLSTKAPYMGYYCHLAVTKDPQPHEDAYLIDSIWIVDHHARWHQETSRNPCSQIISVDDITDEFWWPDISDDPWRLKMSWLPFVIASVPTSLMCAFILRPIFDYIYKYPFVWFASLK